MRIKLDDNHYLLGDKFCCWIVCVVSREGKEYERPVSGYYPTFGMAVENYIENRIQGEKITSLTALKNEIRALKKQIKDWKMVMEDHNEKMP